jgi:DNA-binding NarL/FixJ family response regulator
MLGCLAVNLWEEATWMGFVQARLQARRGVLLAAVLTAALFAAPRPAGPRVFPELTEREREVLQLIGQGRTNEAIAEQLVLSLKTVRNHVANICGKLQVADRAQAMVRAREAGLG